MADERPLLEWALLVAGAIMVVVAGAFIWMLPEETVQMPQFTVRFTETASDVELVAAVLPEGQTDLAFTIASGNLTRIEVLLGITDDVAASDPEHLRVELVSPTGEIVGAAVEAATDLARLDGQTPPAYQAPQRLVALTARVADRPSAQVIEALSPKESAPEAAARVADNATRGGAGAWTLRLTLQAGDCPDAQVDPPRAAACRSAQPDGADAGNPIEVLELRTFHFAAEVQLRA